MPSKQPPWPFPAKPLPRPKKPTPQPKVPLSNMIDSLIEAPLSMSRNYYEWKETGIDRLC